MRSRIKKDHFLHNHVTGDPPGKKQQQQTESGKKRHHTIVPEFSDWTQQPLLDSFNTLNSLLKIESAANGVFFALREFFKLGRRHYREKACFDVLQTANVDLKRVRELAQTYAVSFEKKLDLANTLENYHLLDLLDRVRQRYDWPRTKGQTVVDVGAKNFYYAATLWHFFKPQKLTGIELDAYKLYHDFHTRWSYARFYVRDLPEAEYVPGDFFNYQKRADVITLFLPFVLEYPLVKWTLPGRFFVPQKIFDHAFAVLNPGGCLLMTNQGDEEYDVARKHALASGFRLVGHFVHKHPLVARPIPTQVSLWEKSVERDAP